MPHLGRDGRYYNDDGTEIEPRYHTEMMPDGSVLMKSEADVRQAAFREAQTERFAKEAAERKAVLKRLHDSAVNDPPPESPSFDRLVRMFWRHVKDETQDATDTLWLANYTKKNTPGDKP